jgi:hypothetical protein
MPTKLLLVTVLLLSARPALARDVYFNGVKLEPHVVVRNQSFPACEVRFDAEGNVFITAKGYKVTLGPGGGENAPPTDEQPAAPAKVTKRYWLVAPQAKRGLVQYDIDVFLNGTFVKRVRSGDDKAVLEITKFVRPGTNAVRVIANKNVGDKRASSSPQDVMEVVLGEGVVGGGTITIDRAVVTYRRTAAEMGHYSDNYSFTSR